MKMNVQYSNTSLGETIIIDLDQVVFSRSHTWHSEEPQDTTPHIFGVMNDVFGRMFEKEKEIIPAFVRAFFAIDGIICVGVSRYRIILVKADMFEWKDIKQDIERVVFEYFDLDMIIEDLIKGIFPQ
jgi:hypothetical protein